MRECTCERPLRRRALVVVPVLWRLKLELPAVYCEGCGSLEDRARWPKTWLADVLVGNRDVLADVHVMGEYLE